MVILVSDCLLGKNCRYKGDNRYSEKVADFIKGHTVIGVCPEQAGGLPTPRCPAERVNGKVINSEGKDVTKEYLSGARAALDLAKKNSVDICIMKAGSPSCGCGYTSCRPTVLPRQQACGIMRPTDWLRTAHPFTARSEG